MIASYIVELAANENESDLQMFFNAYRGQPDFACVNWTSSTGKCVCVCVCMRVCVCVCVCVYLLVCVLYPPPRVAVRMNASVCDFTCA